jgi:hypothetical protein
LGGPGQGPQVGSQLLGLVEQRSPVAGRVLQLGVGVGANWPFLSPDIDYVGLSQTLTCSGELRRGSRRWAVR